MSSRERQVTGHTGGRGNGSRNNGGRNNIGVDNCGLSVVEGILEVEVLVTVCGSGSGNGGGRLRQDPSCYTNIINQKRGIPIENARNIWDTLKSTTV